IIDVENGRVIGQHNGYWFHTIGQRKGLGLAGGPWFVVGKDIERNVLFVANGKDPEQQYGHEFLMRDFHFITADPWGEQADVPVSFKIRHTDSFMKGVLTRNGIGYTVRSEQRIQGIAPGQFGVIYDAKAELCLGSGEISTGRGCAIACPSGR
ncbi:MAG: tRNA 2-thiouridine(34) synthase MnmA, partial [Paraprevotella sp.]|nr:tRNA 2-thiouridine(34) synthase MnmA [Paraprevotella sp.]